MELKPQDLLVLLKVAAHPPLPWTYARLGEALDMSPSQVHASVKRAVASGLAVEPERGNWSPVRSSLLEFMVHGVRYIWPAALGPVKRGMPTSFGAEPLASELAFNGEDAPVWAHPEGTAKGPALSPLYRSAPKAASDDPALYRLLSLLDAMRAGRARERALAGKMMERELMARSTEGLDTP